jgi:hypothetical protein
MGFAEFVLELDYPKFSIVVGFLGKTIAPNSISTTP